MGMIQGLLGVLFGNGTNVLRETAEVFRENSEASAIRAADLHRGAVAEFAAEFAPRGGGRRGGFDRFMDGLNRLPRPALALGTLGLLVSSMVDPLWFAARMQGLALVPEPLWWLLGAIVSFYFGARHQLKGQEFQRSVAGTLARTPAVLRNLDRLAGMQTAPSGEEDGQGDLQDDVQVSRDSSPMQTLIAPPPPSQPAAASEDLFTTNPALAEWRRLRAIEAG